MQISINTPALLFPAISLLMVAYSNRFNVLGSRIRALNAEYKSSADEVILEQIWILKKRVMLIRNMQACGVISLFTCVVCMTFLFAGYTLVGEILFGTSLFFMLCSLALSLREIIISVQALNCVLDSIQKDVNE
jgi:hypothetical protein